MSYQSWPRVIGGSRVWKVPTQKKTQRPRPLMRPENLERLTPSAQTPRHFFDIWSLWTPVLMYRKKSKHCACCPPPSCFLSFASYAAKKVPLFHTSIPGDESESGENVIKTRPRFLYFFFFVGDQTSPRCVLRSTFSGGVFFLLLFLHSCSHPVTRNFDDDKSLPHFSFFLAPMCVFFPWYTLNDIVLSAPEPWSATLIVPLKTFYTPLAITTLLTPSSHPLPLLLTPFFLPILLTLYPFFLPLPLLLTPYPFFSPLTPSSHPFFLLSALSPSSSYPFKLHLSKSSLSYSFSFLSHLVTLF